jgi:hypothetical protein
MFAALPAYSQAGLMPSFQLLLSSSWQITMLAVCGRKNQQQMLW